MNVRVTFAKYYIDLYYFRNDSNLVLYTSRKSSHEVSKNSIYCSEKIVHCNYKKYFVIRKRSIFEVSYVFPCLFQSTHAQSSDATFVSFVSPQIWSVMESTTVPTVRTNPCVKVSKLQLPIFSTETFTVPFFISANETGTILGLEVTWFVVVVISTLLVLLVCIVAISIRICRRGWNVRSGNGNVQQQNASYSRKWWLRPLYLSPLFLSFSHALLIRVESSSAMKLICTRGNGFAFFKSGLTESGLLRESLFAMITGRMK